MELTLIESTVVNICDAIADVLDVDVIVVDPSLNIIANTYKHMHESEIEVTDNSIIASSIMEVEKKIVFDIKRYPKCQKCTDTDICRISGIVALPIVYDGEVLGAIGIMLSRKGDGSRLAKQQDGIIGFLENMVELLVGKCMSIQQLSKIETVNHQIEHIIANVKDGIVYLDHNEKIVFYNEVFKSYFNIHGEIKGMEIEALIKHPIIRNYLRKRKNVKDEIFVLENSRVNFQGIINCTNTNLNSEHLGSILKFRKIEETYRIINEMLNNKSGYEMFDLMVEDGDLGNAYDQAKRLAIRDDVILITGAAGTGKKSLAYGIHNFSNRKRQHVITIDCQFQSRDYYLAELFGIGKSIISPGMMQLADKGTIVFHNIDHLPLNIQKDILSYIISGEIELERGVKINGIDVRIIATSQSNLKEKVKEGYFLEELYYRLCENVILLKPLNDRMVSDFRRTTEEFIKSYCSVCTKENIRISDDALDILYGHQWGENLKGYERFIEKLVFNLETCIIDGPLVQKELAKIKRSESLFKIKTFDEYEQDFIEQALNEYKGQKNKIDIVADKLGIGRATLYRKISKYNLAQPQ